MKKNPKKELIEDLEKSKKAYFKEKQTIEEALEKTKNTSEGQINAIEEIKILQKKAFELKHFGKDIKKALQNIKPRNDDGFLHGHVPYPPKDDWRITRFFRRTKDGLKAKYDDCKSLLYAGSF